MKCLCLVRQFAAGFPVFDEAIKELEVEWSPEKPPITIAMSDFGRTLVEKSGEGFSLQEIDGVFQRVERILEYGAESGRDAVATGFLEAIVAAVDIAPRSRWVFGRIGSSARECLSAWDHFANLLQTSIKPYPRVGFDHCVPSSFLFVTLERVSFSTFQTSAHAFCHQSRPGVVK